MNDRHDMPLDATIRAHHQAALDHLSPRVRAQLAQRRSAALRGAGVRRGHGFRYAAASFAALCALAIGLQFGLTPPTTSPMPAGAVASTAPTDATMLDEDPEFYAWLASSDAQQVAME
jgi:hypothetical protein